MIDNFNLIEPLFYFNEANKMFFHCQLLVRNKDHQNDDEKQRLIRTYMIQSWQHLQALKREIVLLCEEFGARAYISVVGKDFDAVNKYMLMRLAAHNFQGNIVNPFKLLNSAIDSTPSRKHRWVIDIDDVNLKDEVLRWLDNYFELPISGQWDREDREMAHYPYLEAEIPTKNGVHLITYNKFDTHQFGLKFPNVEIKKNWYTVLYIPDSILEGSHE